MGSSMLKYSSIIQRIRNIFNIDINRDYNDESIRKPMIIYLFTIVGLICLIFFGIKHLFHNQYMFAAVLGIAIIFIFFSLFYLRKTGDYNLSGWLIVGIMCFLLVIFLFQGGQGKLLWFYVFPPLAYFVLGVKQGGIVNSSLLILAFLVLSLEIVEYVSPDFRIRFLASYIAVSVIAHIFEFVRFRAYTSLKEANTKISSYLDETVRQKEKIETQAQQLSVINEELKKLSAVVQKTGNAVLIMENDGKVEWVNDGFTELYNYNIFNLNEAYNWNLIDAPFNKQMKEMANRAIREKTSLTFESVIKSRDNDDIEVQTTLTPLVDNSGRVRKLIAIDTDIRRLKSAERQLKQLVAMKDKFFSIIAHDLKNPFNSLMGVSQLLIDKYDKYDNEKVLKFIESIHSVSKQTYDLLINLLEWSRSQTGNMEFSFDRLSLKEIADQSIQLLQSSADEKSVELQNDISENTYIYADRNTLNTVFRNLLSNSIKFSYTQNKVKIDSSHLDDMVQVNISDEGVGIPSDKISSLFRLDRTYSTKGTNKETGTGLGLILCKEFVEKNGGTIDAISEEGKGSTFRFTVYKAD
jgi:PAS domain S-box-containing protein